MEPVTHGLVSWTMSRAGLNRVSRMATPILLVAGYVSDWDWISLLGGAPAMLHMRRVWGHSLLSCLLEALLVAAIFWWFGRRHPTEPIRFSSAFFLSLIGVSVHLLLDLPNRYGVALLWPFRTKWYAWEIAETIDPWLLAILLLGIFLPMLLRLVTEEIGARAEKRSPQRWAIATLGLVVAFLSTRAVLRERAVNILQSHVYRGAEPLNVAAFPSAVSPVIWYGVVETENVLHEVDVSLAPGRAFDPNRGNLFYKPDNSPALETARNTPAAKEYLCFARFPIARTERTEFGWLVEIRDLRFRADATRWGGFQFRVELDKELEVIREEIHSGRKSPR